MKLALTHLLAAMAGGIIAFLLISERGRPDRSGEHRATSRAGSGSSVSPFSRRSSLGSGETSSGDRGSNSDPNGVGDEEAFMRELGIEIPTRADLMDYVAARGHAAEAIFAAGMILGDLDLLREALEKEPDNPQFTFGLASRGELPDEERVALAERLLELQPDNAMASYLLAARRLEGGESEAAVGLLRSALSQPDFNNFSKETGLMMEDAYRGTGSSPDGAKFISLVNLPVSYNSDLVQLSKGLSAETFPESGSQELRYLQASMGGRVEEHAGNLVAELVGLSIQSASYAGLPGDSPSPFEGLTVAEASASIDDRREELRVVVPDLTELGSLPPTVRSGFVSRLRSLGEFEACRWLRRQTAESKHP